MSAKCSMGLLAVLVCLFGLGVLTSGAATHYVAQNGQTPSGTFTSWETAASNIQDAVNVASPAETVLVSNGTYTVSAEITISAAITVQSLNGTNVTIVDGNHSVRCFNISAGVLDGFTITNGYDSWAGGGLVASGPGVVVQNCVIRNNSAHDYGGALLMAGGAMLRDSTITANTAPNAGGVWMWGYGPTTLSNCQVIGNTASGGSGGGVMPDAQYNGSEGYLHLNNLPVVVADCVIAANRSTTYGAGLATSSGVDGYPLTNNSVIVKNCLICNNTNSGDYGGGVWLAAYNSDPLWRGDALINCTIAGNQAARYGGGVGCGAITDNGASIVNCIIYSNKTSDAYGEVYNSTPLYTNIYAYTCLRPTTGVDTTPAPNQGNIASDPLFFNAKAGNYRLRVNSPCINAGTNQDWMTGAFDLDGNARKLLGTVDMGAFEATTTNTTIHYVSLTGTNDVAHGYTNWDGAATDIQSAVNVAQMWDMVLVADGPYILTNQVAASTAITIKSLNGAAATVVNGNYPNTTNRCFDLSGGATLDGFTVSNGFFLGSATYDGGGGIQMAGDSCVYNCLICDNACSNQIADYNGGGGGVRMKSGILSNCTVLGNTVWPNSVGGAGGGINTMQGDGSVLIVTNRISGNKAKYTGGGIAASGLSYPQTIANCLVDGNSLPAGGYGGGGLYLTDGAVVRDCVISNNTAAAGEYGGGGFLESGSAIYGSTIIANTAAGVGGGVFLLGYGPTAMSNCHVIANTSSGSGGGVIVDAQYNGWPSSGNLPITIDNCVIAANRSAGSGAGLQTSVGGGVYPYAPAHSVVIRNCLICNNTNSGDYGGGVYLTSYYGGTSYGNPWEADVMINCTIAGNQANSGGGGVCCGNVTNNGSILNCIIYSNTTSDAYAEVYNSAAINTNIYAYTCIRPTPTAPDTVPAPNQGNISSDPRFVNPAAGDYRLRRNSPCINHGLTQGWMNTAVDVEGNPRVVPIGGVVDMGAYENQEPPVPGSMMMIM